MRGIRKNGPWIFGRSIGDASQMSAHLIPPSTAVPFRLSERFLQIPPPVWRIYVCVILVSKLSFVLFYYYPCPIFTPLIISFFSSHFPSLTSRWQSPQEAPYHSIMRAAHVVKGAAANLMCNQLRTASMNLEQAASAAHEAGNAITPAQIQSVQQHYTDLQQAGQNYYSFLQSIGV